MTWRAIEKMCYTLDYKKLIDKKFKEFRKKGGKSSRD
jgi:hypothetical protein